MKLGIATGMPVTGSISHMERCVRDLIEEERPVCTDAGAILAALSRRWIAYDAPSGFWAFAWWTVRLVAELWRRRA